MYEYKRQIKQHGENNSKVIVVYIIQHAQHMLTPAGF